MHVIPDAPRNLFERNIHYLRQSGKHYGYGTGDWLRQAQKPVVDAKAEGHTVKPYNWFAVSKESIFKLNLLGVKL